MKRIALFLLMALLCGTEMRAQDSAIDKLLGSAQNGDPVAQSDLGYYYKHGIGVTRSYTEAAKWIRKSAEQGYGNAVKALQLLKNNK